MIARMTPPDCCAIPGRVEPTHRFMDLREGQGTEPTHRHPWERSRAHAIARLLRAADLPPAPRLLDVGCGDGWLARRLGRTLGARVVVGVDPELSPEAREALRRASPPMETVADVAEVPEEAFDAALLLDVLEHVEDDVALLREAARRVRRGGQLFVSVPAHPFLFGEHDRFLRHRRRYVPRELTRVVAAAGLPLLGQGAWFASLLLPRAAGVLMEQLTSDAADRERSAADRDRGAQDGFFAWHPRVRGVGDWRRGRLLSAPIEMALDLDNRLLSALARAGLPFPGLSLWARCRRP